LANDTETPAAETPQQSSSAARQANEGTLPPFPERRQGSAGDDNGHDAVATQYNAIQEAHHMHEESLDQLREEVRAQRQRLAELRESNSGAQAQPQPPVRLDAILLRISELERKLGEGTPDPLLNEIVHRLASIENSGLSGGPDPRVDDVIQQLDAVKRRTSETAPQDPRTDDVVMRMAAIENAVKTDPGMADEQQRISSRLEVLEHEALRKQDEAVGAFESRLAELERKGEEYAQQSRQASQELIAELSAKVEQIEEKSRDAVGPDRLEEVTARVERVESEAAKQPADDPRVGELTARVEELEKTSEIPPQADPRVEELEGRLKGLEESAAAPAEQDPRLDELATRVESVEDRVAAPAEDPRIGDLAEQIVELELKSRGFEAAAESVGRIEAELDQRPDAARFEEVSSRINALEDSVAQSSATAGLEDLTSRLGLMEGRVAEPASDPRVDNLAERLENIETKTEQIASEKAAESNSATEEIRERLEAVEAAAVEAASAEYVNSKLEEVRERLEAAASDAESTPDPRLDETVRRLTVLETDLSSLRTESGSEALESRVAAIEAGAGETKPDERVDSLSTSVAEITSRLGEIESRPEGQAAPDPRISELVQRLAVIEIAGVSPNQGGSSELAENIDSLTARLEKLESHELDANSESDLVPTVDALVARLDGLETTLHEPVTDPLKAEFSTRLERLESQAVEGGSGSVEVEGIWQRIRSLEEAGVSSGADTDLGERLNSFEARLSELAESAAAAPGSEQETERWGQWARSTLEEIGELRMQVQALEASSKNTASGGSNMDSGAMETISAAVAGGLNRNEVRALRSQMYFVYFAIGMLWVVALGIMFSFLFFQ